jgi:hypothetical protein
MNSRRVLSVALAVWLAIMGCSIQLLDPTATAVPSGVRTEPVSVPTASLPPTWVPVITQAETGTPTAAAEPLQTSAPTTLEPTQTSTVTTAVMYAVATSTHPPKGTCKEGFVYRNGAGGTQYDLVCVPPASKAQAVSDYNARNYRTLFYVYGPDACIEGYVFRNAYPDDVVCVTGAVAAQAAADNAAASSRWIDGNYGAHTCYTGYVWRMARPGDDVCVTGDVYDQTAADNAAANSRKVINVPTVGYELCAPGFVWRLAFTNDHVCVTPETYNQVLLDNAAAPDRTW